MKHLPPHDSVLVHRDGVSVAFHLVDTDADPTQRHLARHRTFHDLAVLERAAEQLQPGDVVVDVGAHVGNHAIFFARHAGARVVAIEPSPTLAAVLLLNVGANELHGEVQVLPAPSDDPTLDARGLPAIDELLLPAPPALLRLAAPGQELELLRGAARTLEEHRPALYVECSRPGAYDEVSRRLAELGYAVRDVIGDGPTVVLTYEPAELREARHHGDVQWILHRLERKRGAADSETLAELQRTLQRLAVASAGTERRLHALERAQKTGRTAGAPKREAASEAAPAAPERASSGAAIAKKTGARSPAWLRRMRKLKRDPDAFLTDSKNPLLRDVLSPGLAAYRGFMEPDDVLERRGSASAEKLERRARKLRLDPDAFFADSKSSALRTLAPLVVPTLRGLRPSRRGERAPGVDSDAAAPTAPGQPGRVGNELRRAPASIVIVCRDPAKVPLDWLGELAGALPSGGEVLLVTHAAEPEWLGEVCASLRRRSARVYLHYAARSTVELVAYGVERTTGDVVCVVDGTRLPPREACKQALEESLDEPSPWRASEGLVVYRRSAPPSDARARESAQPWASVCRAAWARSDPGAPRVDTARFEEPPLSALTALRLQRTPVHYVPRLRSQLMERLAVLEEADRPVDLYGSYAERVPQLFDDYLIGRHPRVEVFERTTLMRGWFVYPAVPAAGSHLDLGRSESPVMCCESQPAWFGAVRPDVRAQAPLVSVVMTLFEDAEHVERALGSVLTQTYSNLEVIVVDDHSRDRSFEVARRAAMHDSRVRLLRAPANRGTYWCKNFGLLHASGDFVTFHDSDDVSAAHRLELQVAALLHEADTIGAMVRYQRLDEAGRVVRFGARLQAAARISLMFRREAVRERYGFFDSVRVSADDELIERMRAAGERVITLPQIGYFALLGAGSLTTTGETAIVEADGASRTSTLRADYWGAAQAWHEEVRSGAAAPRVPFPLLRRPFPAPLGQSPIRGVDPNVPQTITASMATMPSRITHLEKTVRRLLPQVDRLNVFLNEFDAVPDFLDDPKIRVGRSQEAGANLKDNGKFYFAPELAEGYHFTVDDDLVYPPDYVARGIEAIERYQRRAVIGLHGVLLADPLESYLRGRRVLHFEHALEQDEIVHLLGTGTVAYHTSAIDVRLEHFGTTGVADLWFAIRARELDVPRICVRREARWLAAMETGEENLFHSTKRDGGVSTRIALEHGPFRRDALEPEAERLVRELSEGVSPLSLRAAGHDLPHALARAAGAPLKIAVLVNGWNCADLVESCWLSVHKQLAGPYEARAYFFDDASSDGTSEILERLGREHAGLSVIRSPVNRGPAAARLELLKQVTDPDTVCVLLDMDDRLAPHALRYVAELYASNPRCRMSLGGWLGSRGKKNPLEPFSRTTLEHGTHRRMRHFRCPHLRTFRRSLADGLPPALFVDPNGEWLRYCTDVALLLALLDRCAADEVELVQEVLYYYMEWRDGGTLSRFGRPEKRAMHEWLSLRRPPAI